MIRIKSPSRDLNTGPADYKSAALPTKPLRRHKILSVDRKKGGARLSHKDIFLSGDPFEKSDLRVFS
jgi:hypothetical protein